MSGFLLTTLQIINFAFINFHLKFRGPDFLQTLNIKYKYGDHQFTFVHNLLHVGGAFRPQPFVAKHGRLLAMYDGAIYNFQRFETNQKKYASDGECILDAYQRYGESFATHLDGEFAIVLADLIKGKIVVVTDVFGTKPLWLANEFKNGKMHFGVASYQSALTRMGFKNTTDISMNTVMIFSMEELKLVRKFSYHQFDLQNQHVTTTLDWEDAFLEAVCKRASIPIADGNTLSKRRKIFLGLSSGYDSGGIHAALIHLGIPHHTYSVPAEEYIAIIESRMRYGSRYTNSTYLHMTKDEYNEIQKDILDHTDTFYYKDNPNRTSQTDPGAIGTAGISAKARQIGAKVFLSGVGSDNILTNNGDRDLCYNSNYSECSGIFPADLSIVWPWKAVRVGNPTYLGMTEHILGRYGLQARYPLLDKQLVQEFFWLSQELKNSVYKVPLRNFMIRQAYPNILCEWNNIASCKQGFAAHLNLKKQPKVQ